MIRTRGRFIALFIVVLAVMYLLYLQHPRIEAWVWHVRHGEALIVGSYSVPVPAEWYVTSTGEGKHLLVRIDTDDSSTLKRMKMHAGISLWVATPIKDHASKEEALLKTPGARDVLQRTFNVDGDVMLCTGGKEVPSGGILDVEPVGWNCRSDGGLVMTIVATNADIEGIWEIVSGIRRKVTG